MIFSILMNLWDVYETFLKDILLWFRCYTFNYLCEGQTNIYLFKRFCCKEMWHSFVMLLWYMFYFNEIFKSGNWGVTNSSSLMVLDIYGNALRPSFVARTCFSRLVVAGSNTVRVVMCVKGLAWGLVHQNWGETCSYL